MKDSHPCNCITAGVVLASSDKPSNLEQLRTFAWLIHCTNSCTAAASKYNEMDTSRCSACISCISCCQSLWRPMHTVCFTYSLDRTPTFVKKPLCPIAACIEHIGTPLPIRMLADPCIT